MDGWGPLGSPRGTPTGEQNDIEENGTYSDRGSTLDRRRDDCLRANHQFPIRLRLDPGNDACRLSGHERQRRNGRFFCGRSNAHRSYGDRYDIEEEVEKEEERRRQLLEHKHQPERSEHGTGAGHDAFIARHSALTENEDQRRARVRVPRSLFSRKQERRPQMRMKLLALLFLGASTAAFAQSTGSANGTTGSNGTAPAQKLSTQIVPAPLVTTPPINPAPRAGSAIALPNGASTTPAGTLSNPGHRSMGTANSYQNGQFGTVESNSVVTGNGASTGPTFSSTPTIFSNTNNPTVMQQLNGPLNAPGTMARPTPAATATKSTTKPVSTAQKKPQH
jgi:hypothetical protein